MMQQHSITTNYSDIHHYDDDNNRSRRNRSLKILFLLATVVLFCPFLLGMLCEVTYMIGIGDWVFPGGQSGEGCGTFIWLTFLTVPQAIAMIFIGVPIILCYYKNNTAAVATYTRVAQNDIPAASNVEII